jgi:ribosomal protein S15P/S13E
MRTYENTKIYKVVNDVDDATFFGYTSMSLPSRLASLKKESSNLSCNGAVYEHMRTIGKEHFKLMLVETFPCKNKDEVTARIATLTKDDVKTEGGSTKLEAKVERLERLMEQHHAKDNEITMNSCETERLHRELEEQRTLIAQLQEMVQHLSRTLLREAMPTTPKPDHNTDAKATPTTELDTKPSDDLHGGSLFEAQPPSLDPLDDTIEPPSQKPTQHFFDISKGDVEEERPPPKSDPTEPASPKTAQHFDISDGDVEEERPKGIPNYDLTDDTLKVLNGKVDEEHIDILRDRYVKVVRLGKHMRAHPRDQDSKAELQWLKESLARRLAELRVDANDIGLDKQCLKLLDTIEKDTGIGKNLHKKAAWHAAGFRRRFPFEDEETDDK